MRVPFLDVGASYQELAPDFDAAYQRVMSGGRYVLGSEVERFESEFSEYCGQTHCIGVGNGLDALSLTLEAYGVGRGDEVIVPSHTFIATWMAVNRLGATPVPVEPKGFLLDVERLEEAICWKTKAVIPVHLYGAVCDMPAIMDIAKRKGVKVVADAAQAHGTRWLGDAGCFSFYPGKNLGCFGDGGAIVTSDGDLAKAVRKLRNYGSEVKYHHDRHGHNSRLDELQAAFLRVKLPYLDLWNARRMDIARRYRAALQGVVTPPLRGVFHLYVIRHKQRDELAKRLEERGIQTLVHYPIPPHRVFGWKGYPIAETLADEVLSLPIGPHMTDEQVEHVIGGVNDAICSMRKELYRGELAELPAFSEEGLQPQF